ncbi:hypothetical protein [Paraburkholderia hospita]|uniref:Uncharacterized protein n=1 Tax=Paraburkholderia hospita TaxID=169430 RepID=A0AAN1MRA2_9BURK|nr:hypothetical protein [Paraburkholderia hospita]AUT76613.1 hypothetical protein C2L64_51740 [Paraburkholderia hospita]
MNGRTSGARAADLAAIRNWANGDQPPGAVPRMYYVSAFASPSSSHRQPGTARGDAVRILANRVGCSVTSPRIGSDRIGSNQYESSRSVTVPELSGCSYTPQGKSSWLI